MDAVLADPTVLAERYQLGRNPDIYDEEEYKVHDAPWQAQEQWAPYRGNRFVRSCIICANVAESGVTVANVGLVISLEYIP